MPSSNQAQTKAEIQAKHMKQDVIQVPFGGVAASKLHNLFERGYTVCGVAIQRIHQSGNFDRGAITTGGMVMWWRPEQHKSELHRLHEENQTLREKNGLLKYALTAYEKPKEQGHGAAPAPQNLYQITGNVADMNTVLIERAELHRLQAENDGLRALASGGIDLFERYSTFKAKCAELESMLDAVGAGGVGQSIKPQVQADTAQEPVAWRVRPFDYGIGHEGVDALTTRKEQCEMWQRKGWKVEPLYTAPQPTENLHCKSTQKRLATLWGYEKKEPDHFRDAAQMVPASQPLTDEILHSMYCEAMKGYYVSALHYWRETEAHKFARAIEAAVANQPPRQPLTDEQVLNLGPGQDCAVWSYESQIYFARAVEAAHGITGGQQ